MKLYGRLMVRVRAQDLQRACPLKSRSCPIAYALRRETGRLWVVSKRWATMCKGGVSFGVAAPLPMRARLFVSNYDAGNGRARPFTFFITVPHRTLWSAARHHERIAKERQALEADMRAEAAKLAKSIPAEPREWPYSPDTLKREIERRIYQRFSTQLHGLSRLQDGYA